MNAVDSLISVNRMKSGKQRRQELKAHKQNRSSKLIQILQENTGAQALHGAVPVDYTVLAPNNSYGVPEFAGRGYYLDKPFTCAATVATILKVL